MLFRRTLGRPQLLAVLALFLAVAMARAGDIDSAKQRLQSAKDAVQQQNWNSAQEQLQSAETFLEGVPDAEKAPIVAEITALRNQMAAPMKAAMSKRIQEQATRFIDNAADEVQQVPDTAAADLKRASDLLTSDDGKKFLDPDVLKKLQTRIAGVQQMADTRLKKRNMETVEPLVKELEENLAANPFKDADEQAVNRAVQDMNRLISRIRGTLDRMSKDDPDVKAINAKLVTAEAKIAAGVGGAEKAEMVSRLSKGWKNTQEYFAGWDQESQGPTWQAYTHTSSQAMGDMLMPKTVVAIQRTSSWLSDDWVKQTREKYKDDPGVKAIIDEANTTLQAAAAKLNGVYNKLLDEAERLPVPDDNLQRSKPDGMARDAERWFKGTQFESANAARATKLKEKWETAVAQAEQQSKDLYDKMVADASAAWPKIESSVKAEEGFNPADTAAWKGKTIKLNHVFNRAGWDFSGNEFDFAMKINGMPVAGNYAENVRAAFGDAQHRTHQDIDDHKPWDLIAVVVGPGRINERASADVKVTGSSETVGKVEGYRAADCTVLKIIGLHAGPVAIGPGQTVIASTAQPVSLMTGSSAGAVVAASSSSGGGAVAWLMRIAWLIIGLIAAGLVYVKARPQALAQLTAAGSPRLHGAVMPALGGENLAYLGFFIAILGLVQLFAGWIIGDLLPAVALIAGGLYIASDYLHNRGLVSEEQLHQLKPLGVPLAAATAVLVILHLFLGHWWLL